MDARIEIALSADRMTATATKYFPPGEGGAALSAGSVATALRAAGVVVAPDEVGVADVLRRAAQGRDVKNVVLARGVAPVKGDDGVLDFAERMGLGVGELREDEGVDYRERGAVRSVSEGALLLTVRPPTDGIPGTDVTGRPLPAPPGTMPQVQTDPASVAVSPDGLVFHATVGGTVEFQNGLLAVLTEFQVKGNIDYSTGNIRMDHGSVAIQGLVRSGFSVFAKSDITVGGQVEEALLEAGGSVRIDTGLLGGTIRAGGNVEMKYGEGATIFAGGDVTIANSLHACNVTARGRVLMHSGKGVIRGGKTVCADGMVVNEIGSPAGVLTQVVVEKPHEDVDRLREEKDLLRAILRHLVAVLRRRGEMPGGPGAALPPVAQEIQDRVDEVRRKVIALNRASYEGSDSVIRVLKTVHPGATVVIAGRIHEVTTEHRHCEFYFDPDEETVKRRPI